MKFKLISNTDQLPDFPPENPFQTKEYMDIYRGSKHTQAHMAIILTAHDDTPIIAQPITIHRYIHILPDNLGAYAVANYQPYINPLFSPETIQQAYHLLLTQITAALRHKALYIEFRHYDQNNPYHETLIRNHYKPLPWYNSKIPIPSVDTFIANLHRTKRNELRQSLKSQATIITTPTRQQWKEYYQLQRTFYRRILRPLPEYNTFENLRLTPQLATTAIITTDDKVIAGGIMLRHRHTGYTWYYYSQRTDPPINPTLLLIHHFAQTLTSDCANTLDLMGAGAQIKNNTGIRQFKLSLGGTLIPEYRYRKIII